MSSILVAFDGSPEAEKALKHSISIAESDDVIMVLMVLPEQDDLFFSSQTDEITIEEANELLKAKKKDLVGTGLKIDTKVIRGNIVDEIIKASNDPNCKLIIIGYKGVTKIGRFMLGSVSGEVAKRAKKPVLIVK